MEKDGSITLNKHTIKQQWKPFKARQQYAIKYYL